MSHETDHRRDEALVSSVYHDIELPAPSEELDAKVMQAVNKELEKTTFIRPRHALPSVVGSLSIAASLVLAVGIGFMLKTNQSNEAEVYMPEEVKAVQSAMPAPKILPAPVAEPMAAPVADAASVMPASPDETTMSAAPVAPTSSGDTPAAKPVGANPAVPVLGDAKQKEAAKVIAAPPAATANKPTTMQIDSTLTLAPKPAVSAAPAKESADAAPVMAASSPLPIEARSAKVANQVSGKEDVTKAKVEAAEEPAKELAKEKSAKKEGVTTRTASDWIAQIRQLKAKGQSQKAAQELARFSTFYPDQPIPDDLK